MQTSTLDTPLARLVTTLPGSVEVLRRHGLDYCCKGHETLAEACTRRGLAAETVTRELEAIPRDAAGATDFMRLPLPQLIEHILQVYHKPLDFELPRLEGLARRVLRVHGDHVPMLAEVGNIVLAMKEELLSHMAKEENILFPWILAGREGSIDGPIHVMLMEHDAVGDMLHRLRDLTNGYTPREGACKTERALIAGLDAIEADLMAHIHIENHVLFPRARERA